MVAYFPETVDYYVGTVRFTLEAFEVSWWHVDVSLGNTSVLKGIVEKRRVDIKLSICHGTRHYIFIPLRKIAYFSQLLFSSPNDMLLEYLSQLVYHMPGSLLLNRVSIRIPTFDNDFAVLLFKVTQFTQ